MIIHYRTYVQLGITNTFAMINNFYSISNQKKHRFKVLSLSSAVALQKTQT